MWFLGLSTKHPTNLWIFGVIFTLILVIILLRRFATQLEKQAEAAAAVKAGGYDSDTPKQRHGIKSHHHYSRPAVTNCGAHVIRTYALEELKTATRDFRIQIGVGATSFVYLAELGDGTFGALKRVMQDRGGTKKVFLDEVSVLLRISHPNLVGMMGFCLDKGEQLLLLEYVPNKSLFDRMHTYQGQSCSGILSWTNRLSIALDVAQALHYLHSHADPPIIHRDIKSSNVLLLDDNHAKLADFGLCKLGYDNPEAPPAPTSIKGSLGYVDMTYLQTGLVSPKSDVYSFGVLLLELITGLKSTQGSFTLAEWTEECRNKDDIEVFAKLLDPKLKGYANLQQLRALINIANLALLPNPQERPEMSQIVDRISSCIQLQPHHHFPVK